MTQGDPRRSHALRVLGTTIRHYRLAHHLSISELARRARLDRSFVSRLERGLYDPSLLHLWRLAQVLGVPLIALVQPLSELLPEDEVC